MMRNTNQVGYPPSEAAPQQETSTLWPWLIRLPLLGATAMLLLLFLAILGVALFQLQHDGVIYPGVSAYGVKLTGLSKQQAIAALSSRYTYGDDAVFTFRDGQRSWQLKARELGVSFDPVKTVEEAYRIGRTGNLLTSLTTQADSWMNGKSIQPVIVYDQSKAQQFLEGIGQTINRPVKDATIVISNGKVNTTPSQVGRELDVPASLGLLRPVVLNMNTGAEINLVIKETLPALKDAEAVGAQVRVAIASPIQLYVDSASAKDPGPWQISPDFITGMISVKRVDDKSGSRYELSTNLDPIKNFLTTLSPQLTVEPVSARYIFNSTIKQLEVITDSVNGRSLDTGATLKLLEQAMFRKDDRRVPLVFRTEIPKVNSKSTAQELGITESIVQATTFFYGSTANRRTNIQVAAAKFQGLVIAPGEEFSFNKYLGDVSPEEGYETGLVIFGNQTITGVGGGVCQVSSTVFQAAFFGGFPIKERYAHGYRVGYYETGTTFAAGQKYNSGVGLDATVYAPVIDLKFVNDTPYHILMEVIYRANEQSLTFKFYSTSSGRVVTKEGPVMSNAVQHGPPKYQESKDLRPGQRRQLDDPVDGIDVRVWRSISVNGQVVVSREEFFSHYLPWGANIQVAPGELPRNSG